MPGTNAEKNERDLIISIIEKSNINLKSNLKTSIQKKEYKELYQGIFKFCKIQNEKTLHELNKELIKNAPETNDVLLRGNTINKIFLAAELKLYPTTANDHFESGRIKEAFPDKNGMLAFKIKILGATMLYFDPKIAKDPKKLLHSIKALDTEYKQASNTVPTIAEMLKQAREPRTESALPKNKP